ncbi:MAG: immunoglobulin domain-containing protein, partial [Verrucomicrobiota bacterium]
TAITQASTITSGARMNLAVMADGTPPFQYQWYRNGSLIPGANDPLLRLSNADVADAGSYTVRISNGYGTTTSSGIPLTIVPLGLAMESPDTLRVTCAPNQRVRVEVSSDLKTWAALVSQAVGPDGVLRAKTSVGTVSHAFYRVVLE